MNLSFFFSDHGSYIRLDMNALEAETSAEFVAVVRERVPTFPNEDVVAFQVPARSKGASFLYFKLGRQWYSFAWDDREKTLLLSQKKLTSWKLIVGHRKES